MKLKNIKLRTLMLSAAFLGGVGLANTSQAMTLENEDRLGDAGLFQYYTVNNQWQTFFRIINTSDEAVSVKVRFREAANSREVLDFVVFLSEHDMWSGWTAIDPMQTGNIGGTPGIRTNDRSCLMPLPASNNQGEGFQPIPGTTVEDGQLAALFQSRAFTDGSWGNYSDGAVDIDGNLIPALDRMKEGHLEVIGIAGHNKQSAFAAAVRHATNGVPAACETAKALFELELNGGAGHDLENVLGFNGYLIQIDKGLGGGYDPDVIGDFAKESLVSQVNLTDTEVNLDSGDNRFFRYVVGANAGKAYNHKRTDADSSIFRQKQPGILMDPKDPNYVAPGPQFVTGSVDAVSALFMRTAVINEWAAASDTIINANSTQWLLTFPTKNYYVDLQNDPVVEDDFSPTLVDPTLFNDAYAPFSYEFPKDAGESEFPGGTSCEDFKMSLWDREEKQSDFTSPSPYEPIEICYETNVVTFDEEFNNDTDGLDSNFSVNVPATLFPTGSTKGWARITWNGDGTSIGLSNNIGKTMYGLPVTGFLFTVFKTDDKNTSHAAINAHKYTRHHDHFCGIDANPSTTCLNEEPTN